MLILDQVADLNEERFPLVQLIALARDAISAAVFTPSRKGAKKRHLRKKIARVPEIYLRTPYFELLNQERSEREPVTKTNSMEGRRMNSDAQFLGRVMQQRPSVDFGSRVKEANSDESGSTRRVPWLAVMDQVHALPRSMRRALFSGISAAQPSDV